MRHARETYRQQQLAKLRKQHKSQPNDQEWNQILEQAAMQLNPSLMAFLKQSGLVSLGVDKAVLATDNQIAVDKLTHPHLQKLLQRIMKTESVAFELLEPMPSQNGSQSG